MTQLSVVIPTYNRAARIGDAIASVATAELPDPEIIVVDDGSTDKTQDVVRSLGSVRYVRQDNQGAAAARNRGIAEARGRYVLFLDSDDRLLPGAHVQLVDYLERHPEAGVGFPQCHLATPGKALQDGYQSADTLWRVPYSEAGAGLLVFDQREFFRQMILDRCFVHICSVVRKSAIEVSGPFNATFRGYEEWDFYVRLASRFQFVYNPAPGLEIEKHDENMSKDIEAMVVEGVRILEGFLGGTVQVDPDDRPAVVAKLKDMSMGAAYAAFARGDHATARRRLREHMRRSGIESRSLAYFAASCLPPRSVSALRNLKTSLLGKAGTVQ